MNKESNIKKIIYSIDSLLIENKQQKLKGKLADKIRSAIFTDDISNKINEHDFSDLLGDENEDNVYSLFESVFPIFVKKNGIIYRLYKHKIEVDLSDNMKDRYIYMFKDGRLTSGIFECFDMADDEYVYGIEKIINCIDLFKREIISTLDSYESNLRINNDKIKSLKEKENLAELNYNTLTNYLNNKTK